MKRENIELGLICQMLFFHQESTVVSWSPCLWGLSSLVLAFPPAVDGEGSDNQ